MSNICRAQIVDIMLCHHLIWPTLPHDLGFLGRQYLTKPFWKKWKAADAPDGAEEAYACRDSDGTWQIYLILRRELERNPKLLALYHNVQVPMARICHLMTEIGVMTDPAAAAKMAAKADTIICEGEAEFPEHMRTLMLTKRRKVAAPLGTLTPPKYGKKGQLLKQKAVKWLYEPYEGEGTSPWRNGPRTAQFLYKELGLKEMTDATGKVTTGKKALAIAAAKAPPEIAPIVRTITRLRQWAHRKKICSKLTKGVAKRIHASFNVHGTSTGRLSSSGGDDRIQLQNITEEMRVLFVPSQPGWLLWSVDFSQMEARLAAWLADDVARAARFDQPGFNEYKLAASIFLGIPVDQVEKDKSPDSPYHRAKTIVLGTDRALGARKISMTEDIPEAEVKRMQQVWKSQIPATIKWQERVGAQAKRDKYLNNQFGRRCLFYGGKEYTEGISFGPQSLGFDVIARGMIALMYERIKWPLARVQKVVQVIEPLPEPARLLMQVHDELVGEAPAELVPEVRRVVTKVLTQPWPELGGLSLPVNFAAGENWFEMTDLKD